MIMNMPTLVRNGEETDMIHE